MNLKHQPWWLLAGMVVCVTAHALPEQSQPQSPAPAVDSAAPGVKVAIDPKTGQLRAPTEEESRQLDQQAAPSNARMAKRAEPLAAGKRGFVAPNNATEAASAQRRLPAGGVAQQVPESLMTNVAIHRDANGKLVLEHVDADAPIAPAKEARDE